jgi:prepilin-type N-terminal cleavage/methylation domain-containing protein
MLKRNKKGFTLIELVVVIAILAVLAVIAIPIVSGVISDAHESAAEANARTLELAVKSTMAKEGVSRVSDLEDRLFNIDGLLEKYGLAEDELTKNRVYKLLVDNSGNVTGSYDKNDGGIDWPPAAVP